MKISIIDGTDLGKVVDVLSPADIYELASAITLENWAPSQFNNGRRTIKEFLKTSIIALDIDEGCPITEAKEIFKDYSHIIATTKSHQKDKGGKIEDRYRVVLFLESEIDTESSYKATFKYLQNMAPFVDEACKDVSRFFYPCERVFSINPDGIKVSVQKEKTVQEKIKRVEAPEGKRGVLWKSTLELLLEGAPAGARHQALVKATGNMREQGYTEEEIISKIDEMAEKNYPLGWETPHANENDIKTIKRMFERELKYSFEEKPPAEDLGYIAAYELVDEAIEYLSDKEKVKGEPTGFKGLDTLLGGGFRKGELTVLMAQAKTGKNTFLHAVLYEYLKRNISHGYASRELSPSGEVIPNLLSIALGVNAWKEKMTPELKTKFKETTKDWQLYFSPGYGYFPAEEMEEWFLKMKDIGVDFFMFDHFHYALLKEDYEATNQLIKQLKTLTKKHNIHICLIVQPRSLREDERLSLSTLRGGATIGQALDNLLILEREKNTSIPNISKLTLDVARHKLAKTGSIYLEYDPETTRMQEVAKTLIKPQDPPQETGNFSNKPFQDYKTKFKNKFGETQ